MNDEQRLRVYRSIARRIVWERRAYIGLWCAGAFFAGFGLGWLASPR